MISAREFAKQKFAQQKSGKLKGYATEVERACLERKRPCSLHRQSVEPVRMMRALLERTAVRRITR